MGRLSGVATTGRGRLGTDQRGMILVVTLMVVLILALLGSAFLTISGTEHQIAKNDQEIVQALYVAEGGLQTALNQMNLTLVPSTPGTIGPGQYTVTVTDASPPTGQERIVATGYVPTVAAPRAVKQIAMLVCCDSPFSLLKYAVFGLSSVTVSASTTDSYDCAKGPYGGSNVGSNGDVGSNGNITLSGSTQVHGDATAGGTVSNPSHVIPPGMPTNGAPPQAVPDLDCPSIAKPVNGVTSYTPVASGGGITYDSGTGNLTVSGNGVTLTLSAPGTYYFHTVKIQGGGTLGIASGGHVGIYIGGQLTVSGGSFVNNTNLPTNLSVLGCVIPGGVPDTSDWTFSSGGTHAYLGLYAPNHKLTLSGGGNLYGSFIAEGAISETGGTDVHYDECLGRPQPRDGKFVIGPGSWTELAP